MAISDDELYDVSQTMQDALWAMLERVGSFESHGFQAARYRHVNTVASLSPEAISAEFERMNKFALGIGDHAANEEFAAANKLLGSWRGDAAEEFARKLENVKSFLASMGGFAWQVANVANAFYALAAHYREKLHELCVKTTSLAKSVMDDQEKREDELKIASVSAIVGSLIEMEPTKAGKQMLGAFVANAEAFLTYSVKGHNGDTVILDYIAAGDFIERQFIDGVVDIAAKMRSMSGHLASQFSMNSDVYKPMANYVYIESPDFSYEKFANGTFQPPPGFSGDVERERKKMVDESKAEESEIDRRLGGAS